MHLLERYASACGVKIGKPYIYEKYFPIPFDKYITFQPCSKYDSKNYDYWEEVVLLILPYLKERGINIIQIGAQKDKPVPNCYNVCGQTKIQQAAYILSNSMLHFGADSFAAHIASGFNKKIVGLYSNNNIENVKPYWSNNKDIVLLKSPSNKKPSYSAFEQEKDINNIKPEVIAQAILDLLDIKCKLNFKTSHIGKEFTIKTFEVVPGDNLNLNAISIGNPIIRMDYSFNETFLENILKIKNNIIIFTNKRINQDIIKNYKNKIAQIIYIIDENNDPKFVELLKKNLINYTLLSFLPEEDLNKFKLNYLDFNLIIRKDFTKKPKLIDDCKNLLYKSSRQLISEEGQFSSKYDWKNKNGNTVVDDEEFWKEVENFYIFELT
jgi:hypothetical protein